MRDKIYTIICFLTLSAISYCQPAGDINKTDPSGKKQGMWVKKYPGGTIQYEGSFRDDHPVGEFRRYYENKTLKSVLIYSADGREADATIYHPNGFIASKGKYVGQMKEGRWKFYSEITEGYLVSEDEFSGDLLNGTSVKYYLTGNVAESMAYINGLKDGEWTQYYESGKVLLKAYQKKGFLDGKLEVWYENGNPKLTGFYKNNLREGKWLVRNEDGKLKYEINYVAGTTTDNPMEAEAAAFMESLEKNKDKVADPEKNR